MAVSSPMRSNGRLDSTAFACFRYGDTAEAGQIQHDAGDRLWQTTSWLPERHKRGLHSPLFDGNGSLSPSPWISKGAYESMLLEYLVVVAQQSFN